MLRGWKNSTLVKKHVVFEQHLCKQLCKTSCCLSGNKGLFQSLNPRSGDLPNRLTRCVKRNGPLWIATTVACKTDPLFTQQKKRFVLTWADRPDGGEMLPFLAPRESRLLQWGMSVDGRNPFRTTQATMRHHCLSVFTGESTFRSVSERWCLSGFRIHPQYKNGRAAPSHLFPKAQPWMTPFKWEYLHSTPEPCLVNGGVPVFWWKKPCFKWLHNVSFKEPCSSGSA